MSEHGANRKYESLKIPRRQTNREGADQALPQREANPSVSLSDGLYYEIEYDACPIPGVGKFVPKPQKIQEPEPDEIRDLFAEMRALGRSVRPTYERPRFFDRYVRRGNDAAFYQQAQFMADFADDYTGSVPFAQYFPSYQMMGYEQLRTYFTWRTAVRKGEVSDTSLSYAFLYIYELLGNIGVDDPQDGLERLMSFWRAFRAYHPAIDKYVFPWLKDYHIYYELSQPFHAFIAEHDLTAHYPGLASPDDSFNLFCGISKYDIRKSAYFSGENAEQIADCFHFVVDRLRQVCAGHALGLDDSIFHPTKHMSAWTPFKNALFYPWVTQGDRRVVLSENEIYICTQNRWMFSTTITSESGRQLIGYVMKQMEVVLRKLTNYKYKLTANVSAVSHPIVGVLRETGGSLESLVTAAVQEFYRELTKTVVTVNPSALSAIRREALVTQEKLVVPETALPIVSAFPSPADEPISVVETTEHTDSIFTEVECRALAVVLYGEMELKQFADECGIMLEVLIDGINEKAMDVIGDALLDEDFVLYEDYKEQVKEWIQ